MVPPTLVALGTLRAVGAVAGPPVLVVPVVTSAFLLYHVPTDPMNDLGVLAPAHVAGLALGGGAALLIQPGALAAALALGATLLLLGVADHRHPPAPIPFLPMSTARGLLGAKVRVCAGRLWPPGWLGAGRAGAACAERMAATGGTLHLVRVVAPLPTTWADGGTELDGGPLATDVMPIADTRATTAYLHH